MDREIEQALVNVRVAEWDAHWYGYIGTCTTVRYLPTWCYDKLTTAWARLRELQERKQWEYL